MDTIKMKINGLEVEVPANSTILEAAQIAGVQIPTLCYMKDINAIGACRMCVVEVKGARANPAACLQLVAEGMEVQTNTPALRESRKKTIELLLSNHRQDCLGCVSNFLRNTDAIRITMHRRHPYSRISMIPQSISYVTIQSASCAAAALQPANRISTLPLSVQTSAVSRPISEAHLISR